jgi:multidrug resistance efflux pump
MPTIPADQDSVPVILTPGSPRRTWLIALLALAAGSAAAWSLANREPTRFAGRIAAQTTYLNAAHAGIVAELLVSEGDRVSLQDPLAKLADPDLEARIAAAGADVSVRTSEQQQAEAAAQIELTWRMKELDHDIVATELRSADYLKEKYDWELERSMWADVMASKDIVMFDDGQPAFQSMILQSRAPGKPHLNAILKHETADNAVAVSTVQVEILTERLGQLQRLKEALPESVREKSGVAVAGQRLAQARAELERLEARRAELIVKSTAVGTVGVFRARPGDHLQPGQPIVEILDAARRWVVASVPSSAVSAFTPQRTVTLTFPGGLIRAGHVVSIAPQADRPGTDEHDPQVAVRIEESGAAWPNVPLGSRIDVQLAE